MTSTNRAISPENKDQAMKWLILGSASTSLFFWANLYDPFNAPKSWILSITGFWLFGWIVFQVRNTFENIVLKQALSIGIVYLISLTIAFVATDNKFIGLFGDYSRRTGYLSYFNLVIIFIAASYLFELTRLNLFGKSVVALGFIQGIYGIAQHFNLDFVLWNNSYNSVLTTLGNPDFAAAFMGILLILNFGIAIAPRNPKFIRIGSILNVILLFTAIIFSQVRQGLISAAIGICLISIVWIYQRKKIIAISLAIISAIFAFFAIFGMLRIGPLSNLMFKDSISLRGDYWRAGWRMFLSHPIFGVGLDRYGYYFREFRDSTQVSRRGPNLVSNAAHSIPIQLAATGGIIVFLAFLLFTFFILWRGIVGLRNSSGTKQLSISVVFAAWLAYEAQSLISIDNLGLAVWGYLLGGAVVGLSTTGDISNNRKFSKSFAQPLISGLLAILILIISSFFFQSESAMKHFMSLQKPHSASALSSYETLAAKPTSGVFKEPIFIASIAGKLAEANDFDLAVKNLNSVINSDSKNFDSIELLVRIYEYQKNWPKAILLRKRISVLDPFNLDNKKFLAQDEGFLSASK